MKGFLSHLEVLQSCARLMYREVSISRTSSRTSRAKGFYTILEPDGNLPFQEYVRVKVRACGLRARRLSRKDRARRSNCAVANFQNWGMSIKDRLEILTLANKRKSMLYFQRRNGECFWVLMTGAPYLGAFVSSPRQLPPNFSQHQARTSTPPRPRSFLAP